MTSAVTAAAIAPATDPSRPRDVSADVPGNTRESAEEEREDIDALAHSVENAADLEEHQDRRAAEPDQRRPGVLSEKFAKQLITSRFLVLRCRLC